MGTWGFFIGFAAVALYGPAATYFQGQMHLSGLALGLLVAAPQLTGSLLRIPFGAWVDRVGGRLPMLTLFALSLVGMWGLVFVLITVKTLTVAAYPIIIMFGFLSGCGVASFSVGIPQVSYWFPQKRQGTALGAYGGIGNLAPGLFTLLLPYAIAMSCSRSWQSAFPSISGFSTTKGTTRRIRHTSRQHRSLKAIRDEPFS